MYRKFRIILLPVYDYSYSIQVLDFYKFAFYRLGKITLLDNKFYDSIGIAYDTRTKVMRCHTANKL